MTDEVVLADEEVTESERRTAVELGMAPEDVHRLMDVWARHAGDVAREKATRAKHRRRPDAH